MDPEKKSNGALVGSIIIIIILIVGGIYLFKNIKNQNDIKDMENIEDTLADTSKEGTELEMQAELDSIDLEGLDSDL